MKIMRRILSAAANAKMIRSRSEVKRREEHCGVTGSSPVYDRKNTRNRDSDPFIFDLFGLADRY